MNLNSNILKLTGSAEIDQPSEIGKRYAVGTEIGAAGNRPQWFDWSRNRS